MSRKDTIPNELQAHVFGAADPTGYLVETGTLPEGWAAKYRDLVEIARSEWGNEPMWPREIVAAIHFASFYLPLRYDVWRGDAGTRNEHTERELSGLRTPSEIFLLAWQYPNLAVTQ